MPDTTVLYKRCKNPNCPHVGLQPVSNFYVRSGIDHPTEPGHYLSECIDCLKRRSRNGKHLPAGVPRAKTEQLAIDYLRQHKIPALPGKAYAAADVDLLAWGCVRIEVKYSTVRRYNHYFMFGLTRRQQQRGLLADVVLLICDFGDRQTYHFFDPNDDIFYFADGERKGGVTYHPEREEQKKHFETRVSLTKPMMDAARDRLELIEVARQQHVSDL